MNKISIIIPVFNEQYNINNTIENIYNLEQNNFEIIVVDADINGSTINKIEKDEVIKIISPKGRSKQMNYGAKKASGNILLFLHADTNLPKDSLNKISKLINEKKYIAGAFDLEIKSSKFIFRIIEKTASLRSRLTKIPYGDQGIFIEKSYFEKIGSFSEMPLMEDVELMQRIKKQNGKIHIFKEKIITSARRWEKEGIFYCTLRNWIIITLYYCGVSTNKLALYYKYGKK